MEILGALLDRVDLSISAKALTLNAMDPSHVCQVDLVLPGDFFNECKVDKHQMIQIDLKELNQVLKRGRGEVLYLMAEANDNKMLVQMQGDSKRTFKINLFPPNETPIPPKDIEYNAKCSLSADGLADLVGDADLANDYVTVSLVPDSLGDYLELDTGISKDGMEFNAVITKFLEKPTTLGKQSSVYSLEYLKDIVKSQTIASNCTMQFSSEMPLELEYTLEHEASLVFTLAPRIEETEEDAETKEQRALHSHIEDVTGQKTILTDELDDEGPQEDEEITDDD
jgi:proliferating cell nuclear antigen